MVSSAGSRSTPSTRGSTPTRCGACWRLCAEGPVDTIAERSAESAAPHMTDPLAPSGEPSAAPSAALPAATPGRRTVAVVLAAGLGTRMKSATPKVLHRLCGRPMIEYVLDAADTATGSRPIVVFSPATGAVRDAVAGRADTALQDEPLGTGDALRAALEALPAEAEEVLVLSGDVPLVKADLLEALLEARALDHAAMSLVAVDALDPTGLGRVVRNDGGTVERIVEDKDASDEERQLTEINAGLYAFDASWLRRRIGDLRPSATTGELYLTDLVAMAREDGRLVAALEVEDDGRLNGTWMKAGVTMVDPSTVYLDHQVDLAEDVTLEPGVILRGATRVGAGTRIATGSQVHDSVIGDRCEIGNFAEIKNSTLGEHVRQHHMSYLGDADVGTDTNVGAGTVTANYDGVRKHRTTIGERVFLGVDTMLRAPLTVGDDAKTGAGAVVTKDVPPGKLAVGVPAR